MADPRTLCPLDGGTMMADKVDEFHVCSSCRELLAAEELVAEASPATRCQYIEANGHQSDEDYPVEGPGGLAGRLMQKIRRTTGSRR